VSVHLSHAAWRRSTLPLVAALFLAGPASAPGADGPRPSAEPLWKAYPLETGRPTDPKSVEPPGLFTSPREGQGAPVRPAAPHDASPAVTIAYFGALAALILGAAFALRRVLRRRARTPLTCEISWSPGERDGAFRATAMATRNEPRVVAESRRFQRQPPDTPDEDAASRAAYAELVRELVSDGWEPYDHGRDWWATRLRRVPSAGPHSASRRD
jgi:hypothetical protein